MRSFFQVLIFTFALSAVAHANIFDKGPMITKGQYIGGGVLGTIIGFGTGHIVQNRWEEIGWVFTAAELAGFSLMVTSWAIGPGSARDALGITGYLIWSGFKVWEIVDIWGEPLWDHTIIHDSRRAMSSMPTGAVAGISLRW